MSTALVDIRKRLAAERQAVATRAVPASNVYISTQGRKFTFPDGRITTNPIKAVVVDFRYRHEFYRGAYTPGKPKPPVCWAINPVLDDMAPSDRAPEKQADACAGCPLNEFGSAPNGRGKACKNTRVIAIVPADATDKTTPLLLSVSPKGTGAFDELVRTLPNVPGTADQASLLETEVEIGFDPGNTAFPILTFKPLRLLEEKEVGVMLDLKDKAQDALDREPRLDD